MTVQSLLRREHGMAMRMLAVLKKLLESVEDGTEGGTEDLESVLLVLEGYVDRCHHGKEERLVFPEVRKAGEGDMEVMVDELALDHGKAADLLRRMKEEVPSGPSFSKLDVEALEPLARSYIELMREHIRKENARLLPLCEAVFPEEASGSALRRMEALDEELLGPGRKGTLLEDLEKLSARYL